MRAYARSAAAGAPPITAFRAPEWSINHRSEWALDVLVPHGFKADASMAPLQDRRRRAFPRGAACALDRARADRRSAAARRRSFRSGDADGLGMGAAHERSRRVLKEIERANQLGRPAVLTIHPWEIDPDPPRVRAAAWACGSPITSVWTALPDGCARFSRGASFGPLQAAVSRAGSD